MQSGAATETPQSGMSRSNKGPVPLYPSVPAIRLNNESTVIIHRGRDILASLVMSFSTKPAFSPSDLDRITWIVIYSGIVLSCNR